MHSFPTSGWSSQARDARWLLFLDLSPDKGNKSLHNSVISTETSDVSHCNNAAFVAMLAETALEALRYFDREELEGFQMHSRNLRDIVNRHAQTLLLRYIHAVKVSPPSVRHALTFFLGVGAVCRTYNGTLGDMLKLLEKHQAREENFLANHAFSSCP